MPRLDCCLVLGTHAVVEPQRVTGALPGAREMREELTCPFKGRTMHEAPLKAAKTVKTSVETVKTGVETGLSQQLPNTGVETSQQFLKQVLIQCVSTASQRSTTDSGSLGVPHRQEAP